MNEDTIFGIHEYGINAETREIFVGGHVFNGEEDSEVGVGPHMANQFIKNMHTLHALSDDPILVHISSMGGDWSYGMAMYDAIKTSHCYVTTISYAHARSMSSIIPQASDWRVIMPSAYFMIHEGNLGFDGTHKSAISFAQQSERDTETMLDIYDEKCNLDRDEIVLKMMQKEDWYISASSAVGLGFMDEIYDGNRERLLVGGPHEKG